jgi:hypothetical protein
MTPLLPPEARLLLFSTRAPSLEDDRAISELVAGPMNWRLVGALAEREKLLPVLWNRLHGHTDAVPPDIADRIHAQAAVTEFRMAMTETVLHDVVKRLAAENIDVMLLKGAALATTVYPSFAARPMGDLDILVQPEQAQRAWQCLVDAGWTAEFAGGEEFYEGHHHLVGLTDPNGLHLVLEVHRAMLPIPGPFLLDESEVWRDARPVQLGSTTAWVPSDQHLLLHLCVHFGWSDMLFSGLGRTVRDVTALLEHGRIDWPGFIELARRTKASTCAYWTLRIARDLSGASVPETALAALRPRGQLGIAQAFERAQIASALTGACPSIGLMRVLWGAAIRPGASGHGKARPWQVGEGFAAAFQIGQVGRAARVRAHLRGWARWLHFAGIVGIPRRIV